MTKVIKIECIEVCPFYESVWNVEGTINGERFNVKLTRFDTETSDRLQSLVENCSTIEEINRLDRKSTIWYD